MTTPAPGASAGPSSGTDEESLYPLSADRRIVADRVLPSRANRQVEAASLAIGGPVGVHVAIGRSRYWTPVRVVLLMALVVLAFSWFGKAGCLQQAPVSSGDSSTSTEADDGGVRLNWDNQRELYGLCYTDIVSMYAAQRLTVDDLRHGTMPYRTFWTDDADKSRHYIDQPVVIGFFMYGVAKATQAWQAVVDKTPLPKQLDVVVFFDIAALLLSFLWLLAVWATMLVDRRRIWLGALMALSPLVLVHAFTAFEVIPLTLVALAVLAWARQRILLTGVFAGLAAASALYPLLLLPVLLVICLRDRRLGDFAATAVTAVITWTAVNLPVLLAYPRGWSEYFRRWWQNPPGPDSIYGIVTALSSWTPSTLLLNALVLALLGAAVAGVMYVALRAVVTPTLSQLMFLLVAAYLLLGKEWDPQSSLWLVPFAVLVVPYPRLLMAWMVVDALVWIPRMGLFLSDERRWLPDEWFYLAVAVRGLFLIGLCALVIRDLVWPARRPAQGVEGQASDAAPTRLMRSASA